MASIAGVTRRIVEVAARLARDPVLDATCRDFGTAAVSELQASCYEADLPKDHDLSLYAARVRICFQPSVALPIHVLAWENEDGAFRQVEEYRFDDLRVGVGLTDADFDAASSGC